jgi:hypothetical protein
MSMSREGMDCAQFQEILPDLDRPGTLESWLREPALAHAESCSDCAQIMTESEALSFSLRTLAVRSEGERVPLRVEAALQQEFRRVSAETARRRWQSRLASLAFAAMVLLAVGLGLRHPFVPLSNIAGGETVVASRGSDAGVATVAANTDNEQVDYLNESQTKGTEYASSYVALPYAADPSTLSGGTIVRVVLSRPALAALGLPVADMGDSDQIPADVVLSEDGAPQAVRLVSQTSVE